MATTPPPASSSPLGAPESSAGTAASDGTAVDPALVQELVQASHAFDGTAADPERNCWLAVHCHVHGVLPSEYDIREVPEPLYLAVLAARRAMAAAG